MPGSRNNALDGLRLVAVGAVMAFHFGAPGAHAGFLGVDLFFVLSGFLITSLLLGQLERGGIRLADFWTRRARRLIPALLPVLVVAIVWGAVFAPPAARDNLRGDITSTLFYVANWHFISASSYFAADGVVSPLRHMWSLGVEEQFYLGWPLLLALVALVVRRTPHRLLAVGMLAGAGVVFSAVRLAMLWSAGGKDRAYLGTDTRIFEPMIGALLAVLVASPRVRAIVVRAHWPLLVAGATGLAWALAALGGPSGATVGYADGGAVIVAVASAAVIGAMATRESVATRAFAAPAAAYLGRLSYGMYLWHWPLQVWTRAHGWLDLTALGAFGRAALLTALTIGIAALSYRLVETPIRSGSLSRKLVPPRMLAACAVAIGGLFLLNSAVVVPHAGATIGSLTRTIVLVGDSVPQRLAPELAAAAARRGYVVIPATRGSCPATGVAVVDAAGKPWGAGTRCATDVPARQDAAVARYRPALVIWWSRYELADRIDPAGRPVAFGSRAYWALQRRAFASRAAALSARGATVVAVQVERSGIGMRTRCSPSACGPFLARLVHATAAQDVWNAFLASHRSGRVRSISIQHLVCHDGRSPCDDRLADGKTARPDGTHYAAAAAPAVARAVIDRALAVAALPRRALQSGRAATDSCPTQHVGAAYAGRVRRALANGRDVWGESLLRAADGPTYASAAAHLKPLILAGHPPGERSRRLTDSGVYYLPFGQPSGANGVDAVALHVADGGQIVSGSVGGPHMSIYVGAGGRERYGSCLARLGTPRLYRGYLPVLETHYADGVGARYRQESFAVRTRPTQPLVSYVRLTADARHARAGSVELRFVGRRRSVAYPIREGGDSTVYVAWPVRPPGPGPSVIDRATYEQARSSLIDYWTGRLAEGTTFVVPERRVLDAERSLLIQNLEMTWRYSIGNAYQRFEFPESLAVADVLGRYGFVDVAKAIVQLSLHLPRTLYPDWQMGAELLSSARYYQVSGDSAFVAGATPVLRQYVRLLEEQLDASPNGLLRRERYASDLAVPAYGLDGQAVVLQGLRAMADVWSAAGDREASAAARRVAVRLADGLRAAVRSSGRRLAGGSRFVPVELLAHEPPHAQLTATRAGSYWNLVMPYVLASGLFGPRSVEANGVLDYMLTHGSRFLGLVRAGAYSLYAKPVFPTSGSDQVYGLDVARFLADRDDADQLVLSLYGQLAAGMTRGTFVSGEAATIAPVAGAYYRSMYLPPNSVSNATFLETLRLLLIHETTTREGRPNGLQLAYATPRGWLRPAHTIVVRAAPTSFGPVSFSLAAKPGAVDATVDLPSAPAPADVHLRLRLPRPKRIVGVVLNGRPYARVDERTGTVDLSGQTGHLTLTIRTAS